MGTRADFYIGRGLEAKWLGSIAWDGYPSGHVKEKKLLTARTERQFKNRLKKIAQESGSEFTAPDEGWPWPWEDSRTTDYAYAFDEGEVFYSNFGRAWKKGSEAFLPVGEPEDENEEDQDEEPVEKTAIFPDMTKIQNVKFGTRGSGLIVVTSRGVIR